MSLESALKEMEEQPENYFNNISNCWKFYIKQDKSIRRNGDFLVAMHLKNKIFIRNKINEKAILRDRDILIKLIEADPENIRLATTKIKNDVHILAPVLNKNMSVLFLIGNEVLKRPERLIEKLDLTEFLNKLCFSSGSVDAKTLKTNLLNHKDKNLALYFESYFLNIENIDSLGHKCKEMRILFQKVDVNDQFNLTRLTSEILQTMVPYWDRKNIQTILENIKSQKQIDLTLRNGLIRVFETELSNKQIKEIQITENNDLDHNSKSILQPKKKTRKISFLKIH
jgi:hypothetical protein